MLAIMLRATIFSARVYAYLRENDVRLRRFSGNSLGICYTGGLCSFIAPHSRASVPAKAQVIVTEELGFGVPHIDGAQRVFIRCIRT